MSSADVRADRRCYVHIGLQKTGTSYLQSIFWQSQVALRAQELAMVPPSKAETFTLMLAVRDRLREGVDPASAYDAPARLREVVRAEASPRMLLSEESLAGADKDQISRLLEQLRDVEVHVVVTVRDLARQIPSVWQQRLTAGGTLSFDAFLEMVVERRGKGRSFWRGQDLAAILERWSAEVPPSRIHVVTVPPAGSAPDLLLERFCSVLDVDPQRLATDVPRANESLGIVQAELMRRVNVALGDRLSLREAYRETGKMYLAKRVLSAQQGERARIPARLEPWAREVTAAHVAALRDGGYDLVGSLEDLEPAPEAFVTDAQVVGESEVADAAAAALATTLVDRHEALARRRARKQAVGRGRGSLLGRLRRLRSR